MSELSSDSESHYERGIEEMERLPPGPLDSYRKQASFDWFQMKVFIDGGEDVVRFKRNMWKTMGKDPLFNRANDSKLSFDERRQLTMKRCKTIVEYNFLTGKEAIARPLLLQVFNSVLGSFDWSMFTKYMLNTSVSSALCSNFFSTFESFMSRWEPGVFVFVGEVERVEGGGGGVQSWQGGLPLA